MGHVDADLIVLALVAIAVGDELAIAHPDDDATLGFLILAFGGPALFLVAQLVFHRAALGYVPRSRPLGLAALAILAVATAPLTLIAGIAASAAVLVAVAIADTIDERVLPADGPFARPAGMPEEGLEPPTRGL
jgi:low temperature requirement protein LtrA